jgi:hypothetical protein
LEHRLSCCASRLAYPCAPSPLGPTDLRSVPARLNMALTSASSAPPPGYTAYTELSSLPPLLSLPATLVFFRRTLSRMNRTPPTLAVRAGTEKRHVRLGRQRPIIYLLLSRVMTIGGHRSFGPSPKERTCKSGEARRRIASRGIRRTAVDGSRVSLAVFLLSIICFLWHPAFLLLSFEGMWCFPGKH